MTFEARVTAVRIDGEWHPVLGETFRVGMYWASGWRDAPVQSSRFGSWDLEEDAGEFRFEYTADGDEITGPVSAIQALKLRPEA